MSALDLKYDDLSFDVVIDKGTLDAVLCQKNGQENAKRMMEESYRVIKEGGYYSFFLHL